MVDQACTGFAPEVYLQDYPEITTTVLQSLNAGKTLRAARDDLMSRVPPFTVQIGRAHV